MKPKFDLNLIWTVILVSTSLALKVECGTQMNTGFLGNDRRIQFLTKTGEKGLRGTDGEVRNLARQLVGLGMNEELRRVGSILSQQTGCQNLIADRLRNRRLFCAVLEANRLEEGMKGYMRRVLDRIPTVNAPASSSSVSVLVLKKYCRSILKGHRNIGLFASLDKRNRLDWLGKLGFKGCTNGSLRTQNHFGPIAVLGSGRILANRCQYVGNHWKVGKKWYKRGFESRLLQFFWTSVSSLFFFRNP
jgi:hypothetical protein